MLDKNQIKNLIARGELKKALDLLPNIQEGLALKAQFSIPASITLSKPKTSFRH
ncbi:MAG: hypothetical protein IPN94_09175 [Sphingobacteriales bacterium]|nr:hypothetical protein [Sphingobacteriales bacterium]